MNIYNSSYAVKLLSDVRTYAQDGLAAKKNIRV